MHKFPKLQGSAVLSPMAGVTDVAFRALCKKYGASLTYTEFVSSAAIVRGNIKFLDIIKTDKSEKPAAVQLFGSNVEEVISAARLMEDRFDIIDVNCGCPAWKVIKTGAGSEMLKKPEGIAKFISLLSSSVSRPVTVKIRAGIGPDSINAVEVARLAEENGAAAIAIHGRTQKQGYSGEADWGIIKRVKESVSIPVIGNGDVFSPETFKKRLEESSVDYIMIARGAIGSPYIFTQINDYLKTGRYKIENRIKYFFEYLKLAEKYCLDYQCIKAHAMNFTKGIKMAAKLRLEISQCPDIGRLKDIMHSAEVAQPGQLRKVEGLVP